jgi:hypothetical protein
MIMWPLVVVWEVANVAIVASSAWMFYKSINQYNRHGAVGADHTDGPYPERAQAAAKMAVSIVSNVLAVGRLMAIHPGFGLAVLIAGSIAVGLVDAFTDSDNAASGPLAGKAAEATA